MIAKSSSRAATPTYIYTLTQGTAFIIALAIAPTNEAEIASYNMTLQFDYLTIDQTDTIWIRFPKEYDINFGQNTLSFSWSV